MNDKCSFASCDNPASICFKCHGEECSGRFEAWRDDFVKKLKENLINRICRPNKPVNTFQNAREHEEIIKEEINKLSEIVKTTKVKK